MLLTHAQSTKRVKLMQDKAMPTEHGTNSKGEGLRQRPTPHWCLSRIGVFGGRQSGPSLLS